MDCILEMPSYSKFAELNSTSAKSMSDEISQSGWTMYLDLSVDRWSRENSSDFHIEKQQTKKSKYKHDPDRYRTYNHQESSIAGNEKGSSMASDASSAPQNLPLPRRDLEFGQGQQAAGSFCPVSRRIRDVQDKHNDLESVASCSAADVNVRQRKLRKVDQDEYARLLQDTASSDVHSLDDMQNGLIKSESNIEQNLQIASETLGDIEVKVCESLVTRKKFSHPVLESFRGCGGKNVSKLCNRFA